MLSRLRRRALRATVALGGSGLPGQSLVPLRQPTCASIAMYTRSGHGSAIAIRCVPGAFGVS